MTIDYIENTVSYLNNIKINTTTSKTIMDMIRTKISYKHNNSVVGIYKINYHNRFSQYIGENL